MPRGAHTTRRDAMNLVPQAWRSQHEKDVLPVQASRSQCTDSYFVTQTLRIFSRAARADETPPHKGGEEKVALQNGT